MFKNVSVDIVEDSIVVAKRYEIRFEYRFAQDTFERYCVYVGRDLENGYIEEECKDDVYLQDFVRKFISTSRFQDLCTAT